MNKLMLHSAAFFLMLMLGVLFISLSRVYSNTAYIFDLDFLVIRDFRLVFLLMSLLSICLIIVLGILQFGRRSLAMRVSGFASALSLLFWALYCFVVFILYDSMFIRLEFGTGVAESFLMFLPQLLLVFVLLSLAFLLLSNCFHRVNGKLSIAVISLSVLSALMLLIYSCGFIWFLLNMLPGIYYISLIFVFGFTGLTYFCAGFRGRDEGR